jgi:predicted DNA-binding transcriptional regulator AlpA
MVQIIQLDRNELHATLSEIVREAMANQKESKPVLSDRITDLSEVEAITNLKKSSIYKLSANGGIPCAKFGNKKLIFSRSELLAWVENKTVKPVNHESVMAGQLAKSANKNRRK